MIVYQTHNGIFVGVTVADPSPLEENVWLIPDGCVTEPPPALAEGQTAKWEGTHWTIVEPEVVVPEPEPEPTYDELAAKVRRSRNIRLKESDWAMLPDAPVDHNVWAVYRQALRDITDQPTFPYTVTWPSVPE